MEAVFQANREKCAFFHFERTRLNNLIMQAIKHPLVLVCASAGYGKTSAVHDFTKQYQADTAWIQLSERDNVGARFWENYTHTLSQINEPFAKAIRKIGFPDTVEKLNQYASMVRNHVEIKHRIIVMDDFHYIEDPAVIRFVEYAFLNIPPGSSLFIISRSTPRINTAGLVSRGHIFNMSEDDLRFTENELAQYFRQLSVSLQPENLYEIIHDTEGWAFAINLIARSYRKAPGYTGYLRTAMKTNIFRLMETEIWESISKRLQYFLIRLSLIDHLSVDLIALLAGTDNDLLTELERQNAYVRCDSYINAYLIHPLFLEFLAAKEQQLPEKQKRQTYAVAAEWCNKNGFKIDALSYYEKIEDYQSIVDMFIELPTTIPYDIACFASTIFERVPEEAFDTVVLLVSKQLSAYMSQGLWQEAIELAEHYEAKYLKLPKNNNFRKITLASIYYCQALAKISLCLTNDRYDFDLYFEKLNKCFPVSFNPGKLVKPRPGPWICTIGSSRKGAPEEFINVYKRSLAYLSNCFNGLTTGEDELALGELKFYQGEITSAEIHIARALDCARRKKHFEVAHRALLYTMRIAVIQGDYSKAENARKEMKAPMDEVEYVNRYIDYDISLAWYYYILDLPEKIPEWLQENFSPYSHAGFIENFANQVKGRFFYMTRNYPPLLSYIQEMKQRESFLYGRLEMLAIEACVHYRMKNKKEACAILKEAYEMASPNNILMPFIEMGKDMRTLTTFAIKESSCKINKSWLETVNHKSSSYAKRLSHIVTEYKLANGITDGIAISKRESEILSDLSHGLSRTEITANRSLSINAVKMVINNIYTKLGAENLADAIRIATERKII